MKWFSGVRGHDARLPSRNHDGLAKPSDTPHEASQEPRNRQDTMEAPIVSPDPDDERDGEQREKSQTERFPGRTERLMLQGGVSEIDRLKHQAYHEEPGRLHSK